MVRCLIFVSLSVLLGAGPRAAGGFEIPRIADTGYAVPPAAYFVALDGDDAAAGTQVQPFATLGHAIAAAEAGATIVLRAGVYREPGTTFSKSLTIQPYPHEQVWFKGSVVVADWVAEAGRWRKDGWTPEFDEDTYPPGAFDPAFPHAGQPDMVFIDGQPQLQVVELSDLAPGRFLVDDGADRIYIGSDPSGRLVEVAANKRALRAVTASAGGTVIRGLGFMHYAGDRFTGTLQCDTAPVTFENNTVAWAASNGLAVFQAPNVVIRGNTLIYNGQKGMTVWRADGLVVERNRLAFNNQERFVTSGTVSEAAGAKITETQGLTVRDNIVEGNLANGLWFDVSIFDARVVGNLVRANEANGIYYEISAAGIIASNVVSENESGIVLSNATDVQVYNNTLAGNGEALAVLDDSRVNGDAAEIGQGITWITEAVELQNNILSDGDGSQTPLLLARDFNSSPIQDADEMIAVMDRNAYHRTDSAVPADLIEWWRGTSRSVFENLQDFRQDTGFEPQGIAIDDAFSDALFVAAAQGDYRLQPASVAVGAGQALPTDVAAAIGVAPGVAVDLGAFVGLSAAAPPPAVPAGGDGTLALLAAKTFPDGSTLNVQWDDRCTPFRTKLIYGALDSLPTYGVSGAECDVLQPHTWQAVPPGNLWFVAVAQNGFGVEGSWGEGAAGERNGASDSATCGAHDKSSIAACP